MLQIILMGMEQRAPCKYIFCPYHTSTHTWVKMSNIFSGSSLVAYLIKWSGA